VLRLFLILLPAALVAGCSDGCSNSVIDESIDPSGKVKAVMFQRDCGASTGFSTQISVIGSDRQPTGAGNVFIADDDHGAAAAGEWGGPWAEMTWAGPDHLHIRYATKSRIFERQGKVSGIRITYETVLRQTL